MRHHNMLQYDNDGRGLVTSLAEGKDRSFNEMMAHWVPSFYWMTYLSLLQLLLLHGSQHCGTLKEGKERKSINIAPFRTKVHTKRSGMDHTVFACKQHHACLSFVAFTRCRHHSNWGSRHSIAAHYSFIDPERMKGWVGLVGWPIADGLPT